MLLHPQFIKSHFEHFKSAFSNNRFAAVSNNWIAPPYSKNCWERQPKLKASEGETDVDRFSDGSEFFKSIFFQKKSSSFFQHLKVFKGKRPFQKFFNRTFRSLVPADLDSVRPTRKRIPIRPPGRIKTVVWHGPHFVRILFEFEVGWIRLPKQPIKILELIRASRVHLLPVWIIKNILPVRIIKHFIGKLLYNLPTRLPN
jgi:hypothetical protein